MASRVRRYPLRFNSSGNFCDGRAIYSTGLPYLSPRALEGMSGVGEPIPELVPEIFAAAKLLQRKILLAILVSKKHSCGSEIPARTCSVNAFTAMREPNGEVRSLGAIANRETGER